ncbi:MAG TPA: GDSL-type esterase/lipase family protein [Caulobacteraceae bacterium]|nr:GDSL-type esterase/lipase family protein [Caulobacteraceae bacterium]
MMQRTITPAEPPPSKAVRRLVESMLADEPPDMAAFTALMEPAAVEARTKADAEQKALDWANLGRYEAANVALITSGVRPEVVFMGDSITEAWPMAQPDLFGDRHVCRGISGQTSPQMLVRFYPDVVALNPRAVHLLCGTNDIAGNTGPTTPERYQACVRSMTELASRHDIRVILGAIPPAARMGWRPGCDPKPWVAELNAWLRSLAGEQGHDFVDYHTALHDEHDAMRPGFSHDGVHPTRRGYAAMREALAAVL